VEVEVGGDYPLSPLPHLKRKVAVVGAENRRWGLLIEIPPSHSEGKGEDYPVSPLPHLHPLRQYGEGVP